jgi:ubiquinone/menaquinone biosynthesis C-methylase UbiE
MDFEKPSRRDIFVHTLAGYVLMRGAYQKFVDTFGLKGDEHVLDFGGGSGALTRHIAKRLRKGNGQVTCLDTSEAWLDVARRKLRRFRNVKFIAGDITSLVRGGPQFDVIAVHIALHDIDKELRQRAVHALSSTLKNDGRLFIREPTKEGHGMPADEIRELMRNAGLREIRFSEEKLAFVGPTYSGVFEKPPRTET